MTKQEEIREGIERFLIAEVAEPIYPKKLVKLIMQYLHDNDLVIKVDREKPPCSFISTSISQGKDKPYCPLANYVATIPLVEEAEQCQR